MFCYLAGMCVRCCAHAANKNNEPNILARGASDVLRLRDDHTKLQLGDWGRCNIIGAKMAMSTGAAIASLLFVVLLVIGLVGLA